MGADHVIPTEEEDLPARVKEITGGKGARLIFDPIGGPFLQKLAQAAATHGTLFEYGALSAEPTPFPLFVAEAKGAGKGCGAVEVVILVDRQAPGRIAAVFTVLERIHDGEDAIGRQAKDRAAAVAEAGRAVAADGGRTEEISRVIAHQATDRW